MRQHLLTLLLFVVSISLYGQPQQKLSGWLRQAIAEQQIQHRASEEEERLTLVFVRTSETLTKDKLLVYDAKIYAQLGDISIIMIPMSQLIKLSEEPSVLRIEANGRSQLTLDTVTVVNNVLPVYQPTEAHAAFTGKDIVVGVMDVGFDLTHPTFYNNASLSEYRIKAFWDQLVKDEDNSLLPVGKQFIGATDILGKQYALDGKAQGHGTHTTGIAAGSGYDTPYRGIAYESDICLVANAVNSDLSFIDDKDYYKYTSATDALGISWSA